MSRLILMRHGQSQWNKKNLFTGWVDVSLTPEGIEEALNGGEAIKDIPIEVVFTSSLVRAQTTAILAMSKHESNKTLVFIRKGFSKACRWSKIYDKESEKECIPVYCSWRLNERMYGRLQGLNKQQTREKYGDKQVKLWRRSYAIAPPHGESLMLTKKRTMPYFFKKIVPFLKQRKNVFIAAHGNSLRSIIMDLEGLSKDEILSLEIPTGMPIIYDYSNGIFKKCS